MSKVKQLFSIIQQIADECPNFFERKGAGIGNKDTNAFVAELNTLFVLKHNLGRVTGAAGGYIVSGGKYAPDIAFVSKAKQDHLAETGYNPVPPDLAVEVISNPANTQEHEDLRREIANYLLVGTVVWVFNWRKEEAEVYIPGKPAQVYTKDEIISGGDVLPGFELKLTDIYRD